MRRCAIPSRVVVHIGTQKSGSTYLQQVVVALRAPLREAGWCYPLGWMGRHVAINQERPTYGAVPGGYSWVPAGRSATLAGAWRTLCAEVAAHPGPVLISAEALATLRTTDAAVVLADLAGTCPPGTPLEVVITARDLGRIMPSAWQQHVRNGRGETYAGYLQRLIDERRHADCDGDVVAGFWRAYRIAGLAQRWAGIAQVSAVRLVTVPRRGDSAVLWHRFAAAVGLAGIAAEPPVIGRDAANIGITAPEAFALAAVSRGMRAAGVPEETAAERRFRVVRSGFAAREQRGPLLAVPEALRGVIADWADEDAHDCAAMWQAGAIALTGEPSDLQCDFSDAPADPTTEEVLAAVGAAVAVLSRPEPMITRAPAVTEQPGPPTLRRRLARWVPFRVHWPRRRGSGPR